MSMWQKVDICQIWNKHELINMFLEGCRQLNIMLKKTI